MNDNDEMKMSRPDHPVSSTTSCSLTSKIRTSPTVTEVIEPNAAHKA
jgi:hypothetical protein